MISAMPTNGNSRMIAGNGRFFILPTTPIIPNTRKYCPISASISPVPPSSFEHTIMPKSEPINHTMNTMLIIIFATVVPFSFFPIMSPLFLILYPFSCLYPTVEWMSQLLHFCYVVCIFKNKPVRFPACKYKLYPGQAFFSAITASSVI